MRETFESTAIYNSCLLYTSLRYNAPRINAYKKMGSYNVKGKHLPNSNGNWAKFSTGDQEYLRKLGREAIRKTPMKKLISNSPEMCIRDRYHIFQTKSSIKITKFQKYI